MHVILGTFCGIFAASMFINFAFCCPLKWLPTQNRLLYTPASHCIRLLHIFVHFFLIYCEWSRRIVFRSIFCFLLKLVILWNLYNVIEILSQITHPFEIVCQLKKHEHARHLRFAFNQVLQAKLKTFVRCTEMKCFKTTKLSMVKYM